MRRTGSSMATLLLLAAPSLPALELSPVIVTATRTAQTADETLASVTVITRADMERRQAQSVQDILRGVPGIGIANSGGAGKNTSVFLRGTNADHVLVLVDGVKVGSVTLGTTSFQHIPMEQIERIEVVRGPRSSLYGSEAVGGVIQIFTRKGGGELKPSLSLGYGRDQTYNVSAGVSGGGERGWFNLMLSAVDTQGFDVLDGGEPDDDGYREWSGALRAGYRFDNGLKADLHLLHAAGDTEFDGFEDESDIRQQVFGGSLIYSPTDNWQLTLTGGLSRDESENFNDGSLSTRIDTERDTLSLQNDLFIGDDHLLTLGFDYQNDKVDSTNAYTVTSRDNKGVFGQYQGSIEAHDVQISARLDDNQQFGRHATGAAAWGYAMGDNLRLTASYGTAFKAPTLNELYWPLSTYNWGGTDYIEQGNPDLPPEESETAELGLRYALDAETLVSVSAYETRVENLIEWSSSETSANEITWMPANADDARIRGIEAVLATRMAGWDIDTTLTLLDPKNRSSGDNDGNLLPKRARQSWRFDADRKFGKYTIGGTLFAEGPRFDDLANTDRLAGYATLDLRAEYAFARDWRVQARLENLFDKDYETVTSFGRPYNQPGRGLFVTVRYRPE